VILTHVALAASLYTEVRPEVGVGGAGGVAVAAEPAVVSGLIIALQGRGRGGARQHQDWSVIVQVFEVHVSGKHQLDTKEMLCCV
jgi:hypothetical protein